MQTLDFHWHGLKMQERSGEDVTCVAGPIFLRMASHFFERLWKQGGEYRGPLDAVLPRVFYNLVVVEHRDRVHSLVDERKCGSIRDKSNVEKRKV